MGPPWVATAAVAYFCRGSHLSSLVAVAIVACWMAATKCPQFVRTAAFSTAFKVLSWFLLIIRGFVQASVCKAGVVL